MNDSKEAIALFLLKGGRVTKVAADKPKLLTDRQWYRKSKDDANERIER